MLQTVGNEGKERGAEGGEEDADDETGIDTFNLPSVSSLDETDDEDEDEDVEEDKEDVEEEVPYILKEQRW
jgi:hypothetical protein